MLRETLMGTAAGAAGTVALNVTTYADMALRGRPASEVPAEVAGTLAEKVGLHLDEQAQSGQREIATKAKNRESGLGALLGYVAGLGVGTAYGLIRPRLGGRSSRLLAGAALGMAAMATGELPGIVLGKTNPKNWGAKGWLADIVPHLAYGLVTAAVYEAFAGEEG